MLNPTTCIPMQVVGFRLTHLYYVDILMRITSVDILINKLFDRKLNTLQCGGVD